MNLITLKSPYLIFLGDVTELTYAKTGAGLAQWRPELCAGQLTLAGGSVDLGLPPMTIEEAANAGVGSLIIGTATVGGVVPTSWLDTLVQAAEAGLDIVSGAHGRLQEIPHLAAAAKRSGAKLVDVRVPPAALPVGSGKRRTGKRLLTVGTDCAVGKKYTALALHAAMKQRGMDADFRASGQTGIMISGRGIPMDSVVSDFLSGAAELLSPENTPEHWDVIEGQGAITHPAYGAVSMGLLMGSQPDAFVVCHEAGRTHIAGWPEVPLAGIAQIIQRIVSIGELTNPGIRCVGVSVNTSGLRSAEREEYLRQLERELRLPCVDPLVDGVEPILEQLTAEVAPAAEMA
ncbi:DUF1611 domain-containing protein [Microbulbifer bruguierae]|uniref:DUF1611 domain-containing protein n=1 Tax=Microbulbifer bruguierae TaxID=3029061 RepID=A0ABY8NHJ2_9GAMM|nr:DUF1611 domain-containing protein [Microbulbifer bruguierae]WGL17884.1 DUF1611 domain-containing protein [Microbulbifer bruguierae]